MDAPVFTVIGAVSGIAGIAGLFISLPNLRSRIVHFVYCAAVAAISSTAIYYFSLYQATQEFDKQIWGLLSSEAENNNRGLMLASLALLERNKERFPDTYIAAKQLCEAAGLTGKEAGISTIEGAHAMAALLRGLAKN